MYQFSRSIYRALCDEVTEGRDRARLLGACESAVERLARDPHYFARPARTLFNDVRIYFPIGRQRRVLDVIETHMRLAVDYVDQHARAGVTLDGSPLSCHATTRKGSACQRVPLPGSQYCPSHKHLEEGFDNAEETLAPVTAGRFVRDSIDDLDLPRPPMIEITAPDLTRTAA